MSHESKKRFYITVKRVLDMLGAAAALALLSPVMLILALCVRLRLGKPIIFRQQRPGLHSRPFILYKFRTMFDRANEEGRPLPDEARLARLGRILRNTSLDELPTFLNVLKGEMSFVGPRPLLTSYLDRYTPKQARRHEVKPGITGWAQINGRNALTWEEKFTLDVWYVDNLSLALDMKILWLTIIKVFKREGISAENHATMPEFTGKTAQ